MTIKNVPPSLNRFVGRKNVWEYRKAKAEWTDTVYNACVADKPDKPPPFALVSITYTFPDRRRRDGDNLAKFILDGLTRAGWITDDDLRHISLIQTGRYEKGVSRTEISVTGTPVCKPP